MAGKLNMATPTRPSASLADLAIARRIATPSTAPWELYGRVSPAGTLTSIAINEFPFTIGRNQKNLCTVAFPTVSSHHAEITLEDGRLRLKDLNSTNGTFINGRRLEGSSEIKPGDVTQFGTAVFTLNPNASVSKGVSISGATECTDAGLEALAHLQFDKLMGDRAVVPFYQPIVRLLDRVCIAYEVLARSRLIGLEYPAAMFRVAGERGVESRLSQILRQEGVRKWTAIGRPTVLYLNTHPAELSKPGLVGSLEQLRLEFPEAPLVLEIHESAVTNVRSLLALRNQLKELNIGLAYDDFGAGQSRLTELAEVPPDVLKFDMNLVKGLGEAPPERRMLIRSLLQATRSMGVQSLAEGVESESDAWACIDVGFDLAQGYYFGTPASAKAWQPASADTEN